MAGLASHERLKRARAERGEDLAALSARTGLRVHHVRAIEDGRFADLPPGIYGRAAIRAFAAAYALDADEVLAGCETLLPQLEDPIGALARLRGVARVPASAGDASSQSAASAAGWRTFAAITLDACSVGILLAVVSIGAALLARVSPAALSASSISLALVGGVLACSYFIWLGGLAGTTLGEFAVGSQPRARDPRPLTLRAIALRTLVVATADARAIHTLGLWAGRFTRADRSARPREPEPSLLPLPDLGEVLTWSASGRASVPPPRPRRRRDRTPPRSPSMVS